MKVLGELLRIKEFREEKAELESSRARLALDEATDRLDDTRRAREDYQAWWTQREQALYDGLCARPVLRSDIEDVSQQVDRMRERMREHDHAVAEAEDARKAAFERRNEAREAHREATRTREKFSELDRVAEADWLIEQARVEDLELEEVASRSSGGESAEAWLLEAQP